MPAGGRGHRLRRHPAPPDRGLLPRPSGRAPLGSPRPRRRRRHDPVLAICAQWFLITVDPATGHIRIIDSVHVADAGLALDPAQCRAQIEGAVVQGVGTTLWEELPTDHNGRITTTDLRSYTIPGFGHLPATTVHLLEPRGTAPAPKPMSELPFNPVTPALANALRDASGLRFTALPLRSDTVWTALDRAD
ncbi:molybdopterin cofactor-binding domain-containing protein [Streptomyces sp.]|uniref:molybdopterin cofactor-binding domain-containing protein n=1 Tax=Streptomyces sp. TaxID=1931 RepID=UPI002811F579|nr:molybdopterin cofactor-binding domain-containing protein [Streptomyces sp.]